MKPDCYKCEYRRNVPGDCHSRCAHPKVVSAGADDMIEGMVSFFLGEMQPVIEELNIRADKHGVEMGWFMWPGNFDPVWLDNCNGFKAKKEG